MREKITCQIPDCTSIHFGKGYCRKHYLIFAYAKKPIGAFVKSLKPLIACKTCQTIFTAYHKNALYCSMSCSAKGQAKPFIIKKKYKKVLAPQHHRADGKGYVFEHIIVAEKSIGRPILKGEAVHHIDHDPLNNAPENLQVFSSHAEHMKAHHITPS